MRDAGCNYGCVGQVLIISDFGNILLVHGLIFSKYKSVVGLISLTAIYNLRNLEKKDSIEIELRAIG